MESINNNNPAQGLRKGAWTKEEDDRLRECIEKYGQGKWHQVPLRSGLNRCRKSCRLRWLNYLRPNIKRGCFSKDEVDLIVRLHKLLGNRWSLIAGRIPGRTANDVKNYWNSHVAKKLNNNNNNNNNNNVTPTSNHSEMKNPNNSPNNTYITKHEIIRPRPRPRTFMLERPYNSSNNSLVGVPNDCATTHRGESSSSQAPPPPSRHESIRWWSNLLEEAETMDYDHHHHHHHISNVAEETTTMMSESSFLFPCNDSGDRINEEGSVLENNNNSGPHAGNDRNENTSSLICEDYFLYGGDVDLCNDIGW